MKFLIAKKDLSSFLKDYHLAEQLSLASGQPSLSNDTSSEIEVVDGVAMINIHGVLLQGRVAMLDRFGANYTAYTTIREQIAQAEASAEVESIQFNIDSPGGQWDGVDLTAETMFSTTKPTVAYVQSQACSAGYYLASQCDDIIAQTKGTQIGSIGVAVEMTDWSVFDDKNGIKDITVTNTLSPDKRPDISTEEGIAVIRDELDDLYTIFEERVVEGRELNMDFSLNSIRVLAGRVVTAKRAKALGLIDTIESRKKTKESPMTKQNEGANLSTEGTPSVEEVPTTEVATTEEVLSTEEVVVVVEEVAPTEEVPSTEPITKGEEDFTAERERIVSLLALAGVSVTPELQSAIADGEDEKSFALAILKSKKTSPAPTAKTFSAPSLSSKSLASDAGDDEDAEKQYIDSLVTNLFQKGKK